MAPGDSFIALTVIRSLGRKGVRVVAMTSDRGMGRFSRYCWKRERLPQSKKDLPAEVRAVIRKYEISHVLCTSEDAIVLLNEHREELEEHAELLFPRREIFDLALHKDKTLRLAATLGIPSPQTVILRTWDDLRDCAKLQFPVILKPRHRDIRLWTGEELAFKVDYVSSYEELTRRMACFRESGEFPLVQEYCPGRGLGVEVLMRHGQPLLLFQHRRIHEYPPRGGVSVFCESVPLEPQVARWSVALLQAMNWDGVAMVEFRNDESTGRLVLMEVNGRFWGSIPLAVHAGADFPFFLYASSLEALPGDAIHPPRVGLKCRVLVGHTKWLWSVLTSGAEPRWRALGQYLAAFHPAVRYYAASRDDPWPAVMNVVLRIPKVLEKAARRLKTRGHGAAS